MNILYRDGEIGIVEDGTKLLFGEPFVAVLSDGRFYFRHAVEVAQEVGAFDTGGIKALVTQFRQEATVSNVNLI